MHTEFVHVFDNTSLTDPKAGEPDVIIPLLTGAEMYQERASVSTSNAEPVTQH